MITKEEVITITTDYLNQRNRKYTDIDSAEEVIFRPEQKVMYGKKKGQLMATFTIGYGEQWGTEIRSMFVEIDAESGEVLYSISPHGWIEEMEKPDWYSWFGFYPAKASVNAAKARLNAMDKNIEITQEDAIKIFTT